MPWYVARSSGRGGGRRSTGCWWYVLISRLAARSSHIGAAFISVVARVASIGIHNVVAAAAAGADRRPWLYDVA